ncbi:2'-5' RNA ligase family protein [Deinococcus deserti]|uniref:Putative 2-5 RNA ligase n=1 Tax=Deinococcus deserti (strain DSM 17065 / CIP 109153 / LMG 22923 / VCD115) TaxID=546414 RepID=C1D1N2_DEIDV|nr:2'-5' RNA ligase family protein [Deinococcus deserti]ACO45756.1 putative 2-5 RNA ligase [Deinococcus deserti VCD115]
MSQTSVLLWLPELDRWIGHWRQTLPAARRGVAPHVSLLFPWVSPEPAPEHLARLEACLRGTRPVSLSFSHLGRFPGLLWLAPEPAAEIRALMRTIARAFPETPPYSGKHPDPEPHLTVARGGEDELDVIAGQLQALLPELAAVRYLVDRVTVAQKDADNRWRVAHEVPLQGG